MSDKEIEEMEAYQNLINRIAMSDKETKERIHNESEVSAKRAYIHKTSAQLGFKKGYISGAESERPKAWNDALDAAIERIPKEWNHYATLSDIINTLEDLKHKQP